MKIQIISDVHLEQGNLSIPKTDADVLVLAGDVSDSAVKSVQWAAEQMTTLGIPVVLIHGNHEFWDGSSKLSWFERDRELAREAAQKIGGDLHLLDCGTWEMKGVRFICCTLWTDYMLPVFDGVAPRVNQQKARTACAVFMPEHHRVCWEDPRKSSRPMITTEHLLSLHLQERAWLQAELVKPFDGRTVVVTHHAPSKQSIDPNYASNWASPAFASALPAQFFDHTNLWIHGHLHRQIEYSIQSCKVVCNPRGNLGEVVGFDPAFAVEI